MNRQLQYRIAKGRGMQLLVSALAMLCIVPLILILFYIVKAGIGVINWSFLTELPKPVGMSGGGIANALLGTVIIVLLATLLAVPVGIFCGVFLTENKGRLGRWTSVCVEILQGIPSIVIGIVAYFWMVRPAGSFSGIAGSVALAMMMLPVIIRSTEETLKLLPGSLREAGYALGMPFHRLVLSVIIPCGFSGILSGVMLSVARVAGETAPLLFTAFGNPFMETNPAQPMQSIPLLIFNYATSPYQEWQDLAWGASLVLLTLVLTLNLITKLWIHKKRVRL